MMEDGINSIKEEELTNLSQTDTGTGLNTAAVTRPNTHGSKRHRTPFYTGTMYNTREGSEHNTISNGSTNLRSIFHK